MILDDLFSILFYENALKITFPEQLNNLQLLLNNNFTKNALLLDSSDPFENTLKEIIFEEAVNENFNEEIIKKALELGFYPMSMAKRITKLEELSENDFNILINNGFTSTHKFFRNFLTIKYHSKKLIITFDRLHITKKLKPWLKGKFSDYTITFNKNFDKCIEELLKAYPETWLTTDLVEKYKLINKNPDKMVSVDSVEIWHNNELVAGEIGFITHNAYASLSGFHKEKDIGTVQMCILGLYLKNNNFAYWDLGMELQYKYRFGAVPYNRIEQQKLHSSLDNTKFSFPKEEITLSSFLKYI